MSYETLDNIADAYIPILAIMAFLAVGLISSGAQSHVKMAFYRLTLLIILLGMAYGFMALDNAYIIWPHWGLDYSTHTAVSLVLVLFLVVLVPRLFLFWLTSLIAYCGLMLYQNYHSVADVLSTAFALMLTIFVIFIVMRVVGKADKLRHSEVIAAAFSIFR